MADLNSTLKDVCTELGRLPSWLATLALAALLAGCGGGGGGVSEAPAATAGPGPVSTATSSNPAADPAGSAGPATGTTVSSASTGPAPSPVSVIGTAANVQARPNVLPVTVNGGPRGDTINIPSVSVTICEPGTTNCRTVDHVLVDTGSYGLRLAASAVGSALSLPVVADPSGAGVGECAQFASGWAWGSVRRADVRLAGEIASNIPIQIVSDTTGVYGTVPSACRNLGRDVGVLHSNGILGVGMQPVDCGAACVSSSAPGLYYACRGTGCVPTALPLSSQVANPVSRLPINNNGVIFILPPVPSGGAPVLFGSLVFGIDTQDNNRLGPEKIFQTDSRGNFTTTYKGASFPLSFIDSGSNALFFPDPALPACFDYYCPPAPLALSAINTSATGVSGAVDFTVVNFASAIGAGAAAHIGGDIGLSRSFDWGLPFFFGRKVFVAMHGATTSKESGPFWAY